jgi:hypothetical protein
LRGHLSGTLKGVDPFGNVHFNSAYFQQWRLLGGHEFVITIAPDFKNLELSVFHTDYSVFPACNLLQFFPAQSVVRIQDKLLVAKGKRATGEIQVDGNIDAVLAFGQRVEYLAGDRRMQVITGFVHDAPGVLKWMLMQKFDAGLDHTTSCGNLPWIFYPGFYFPEGWIGVASGKKKGTVYF